MLGDRSAPLRLQGTTGRSPRAPTPCPTPPAVHQYDIVLDVNVINRTNETMQVGGGGQGMVVWAGLAGRDVQVGGL